MSSIKAASLKSNTRYFAILAYVLLVLGFFSCTESKPKYSDYSNHEVARFFRKGDDPNLRQAQSLFNAKDYGKAIFSFEDTKDLTNPEVQYFYAIALIETNHYRNAELYLDNIRSGNSVYKDDAAWYLALSSLKQQKLDECRNYLTQVPATSKYNGKAQKLLEDLR